MPMMRARESMDSGTVATRPAGIGARVAAHMALAMSYAVALAAVVLRGTIPRSPWRPTGRILVTGTFHNPNWYLSHLVPLAQSVNEVVLVVDEPQIPVDGVRFVCPPRLLVRLLGRAMAKLVWVVVAGLRLRPDLYMGYYLVPAGCTALVAARLLGRPACYQMTGGPMEVLGGGVGNPRLARKGTLRPAAWLERMALSVVRAFDLVVVRGQRAKAFLTGRGLDGTVTIITGSVDLRQMPAQKNGTRPIDLVYVGRLDEVKQPHQVVRIVEALRQEFPALRAALVGDGPLMDDLRRMAERLGVNGNVQLLGQRSDVGAILTQAKLFLLTSRSEGLSIAMAEAMAAGTVPVVANVGDLADLVVDGVNGFLVRPDALEEYQQRVRMLLTDPTLRADCSRRAMEAARQRCELSVISNRWRQCLARAVSGAAAEVPWAHWM